MNPLEQKLKALDAFKDWSNYLLVTTLAAVGWVGADAKLHGWWKGLCLFALGLSAILAILTLAIVPVIAEKITEKDSIYETKATFLILSRCPPKYQSAALWPVCLWQHGALILGIILYVVAAIIG